MSWFRKKKKPKPWYYTTPERVVAPRKEIIQETIYVELDLALLGTQHCVKCGGGEVDRTYESEHVHTPPHYYTFSLVEQGYPIRTTITPEHMRCECANCHYSWNEGVLVPCEYCESLEFENGKCCKCGATL